MLRYLVRVKDSYRRLQRALSNNQALTALAQLDMGYVPWTGYALSPSVMLHVVNEAVINNRQCIVEFGAGISTIYLAKVIQQRGTSNHAVITSIEDDPEWADVVRRLLRQEGCRITLASL